MFKGSVFHDPQGGLWRLEWKEEDLVEGEGKHGPTTSGRPWQSQTVLGVEVSSSLKTGQPGEAFVNPLHLPIDED